MAVEVIGWVFARSRSRNGQRLVMLAVADACNKPDGTGAWMSNAALCAKTGLSERAVQVAVRECEELGELGVDRGRGRGGVNRFRVLMAVDNPVDSAGKGAESAGFPERAQNLRGADSAGGRTDEGPQARAGKGAESAGQRARRKGAESAPGTVGTSSSSGSTGGERAASGRGTRLPADFHATPEMIVWAREHTPNVGIRETEAFIDHFRSAPGQKGVKLDWLATWRNWMRREQKRYDDQLAREQRYGERRNGQATPSKPAPAAERCPEHPSYHRDRCGPCRSERGAASNATDPRSQP